MLNKSLADHLSEIGDLLELNGENVFRVRAFRKAAETIESTSTDLGLLSREERLAIPGIGKGIADIIEQFHATGKSKDHDSLKKLFPEGVLHIMRLGGIGPKRAAMLFKKLGIDSLAKLKEKASKGDLQKLDGFGEKLEEKILKNIDFVEKTGNRLLINQSRKLADEILIHIKKAPFINQLEIAGSVRRWKETNGDLDFLCTSKAPEKAIAHFLKIAGVRDVLASGKTKASVLLQSGLQCDFRVVEEKSFGAAWLYFTGSKEHNVHLREWAIKKGLSLNEYGLFKASDTKHTKPVASRTEEDVYAALGMKWIPPELREDRGEIEAALNNELPNLVEMKDIKGDFHNHTTLSDGANTLEEMVEAAQKKGWSWFYSADHSPSLKIANGLSNERLIEKMKAVRKLDQSQKAFRVFTSSEVDILKNGELDYSDAMLKELDCVIASVHTRFNMTEEEMTDRICKAVSNDHVDILGHLSGRLINKRDSYAINTERILETAAKTNTAVEINGQPERQELNDVQVKRAIKLGVPLVLTTDAHSTDQLSNMETALHIARRGWAEAKDILNTKSAKEIETWLNT